MCDLELVKPGIEYSDAIVAYKEEFVAIGSSMDGCGPLKRTDDPVVFLKEAENDTKEECLLPGRVLADIFFLVKKGEKKILGMCQVRRYLNEHLLACGGHVGYSVCPSERRKGYAKAMLKLALEYCKSIGIDRALVTCNEGNIPSEKTILSAGGVYENKIWDEEENCYVKRFWIDL